MGAGIYISTVFLPFSSQKKTPVSICRPLCKVRSFILKLFNTWKYKKPLSSCRTNDSEWRGFFFSLLPLILNTSPSRSLKLHITVWNWCLCSCIFLLESFPLWPWMIVCFMISKISGLLRLYTEGLTLKQCHTYLYVYVHWTGNCRI